MIAGSMELVTLFTKYGPEWILIAALLSMLFVLVNKVLKVIENNTSTISKFSEIVSHCDKKEG